MNGYLENDIHKETKEMKINGRKCILPAGHLHRLKKSVKWCQTKEKAR